MNFIFLNLLFFGVICLIGGTTRDLSWVVGGNIRPWAGRLIGPWYRLDHRQLFGEIQSEGFSWSNSCDGKGVFNYFEPSIVRELKSSKLETSIRASNDLCLTFESSNSFINTYCLLNCHWRPLNPHLIIFQWLLSLIHHTQSLFYYQTETIAHSHRCPSYCVAYLWASEIIGHHCLCC